MSRAKLRNLVCLLFIAVIVVGVVAGCSSKPKEPIKIGGISPLSGTAAKSGASMKQASELAVKEINDAGGIDGRPLELIWEDDEGVPVKSVSAMEKLVMEDQVLLTIGPFNSSCGLANLEVSQREKCPQIVSVAFAASITRPMKEYVWRNIPQAEWVGLVVGAAWCEVNPTAKNWAIIHENSDFGRGYLEYFKKAVEDAGNTVVDVQSFNLGDTDMYAQLTAFKNKKPDAVIIVSNMTEAAQILRQARELNFTPVWCATGSEATDDFYKLAGDLTEGLYSLSFFEPTSEAPTAKKFVEAYTTAYGNPPDMFGAACYDAVYIAKAAIEKAGTKFDDVAAWRAAINAALPQISVEGAQGVVKWNEYHEAPCALYIVQWKGGKRDIVKIAQPE